MKNEYKVVERDEFLTITVVEDVDGFLHNVTSDLIYSENKHGNINIYQISKDLLSSKFLMTVEK